ncbi:restriction endonuclease subunit S [Marinobacter sp. JSM 1782161]|uniref:restriction endonuclease subunit S n=1 Tax=Marinobacter sp. JSM 1782161 TaxID=2685906 RepID=UPI00140420D9|nr:restriction endonuclease subunit S [Marinobacter sp. JSM 1782161]
MKQGWAKKKLRDVSSLINGRAYKKSELLGSGLYPVLRVGNFFTNRAWYYSDLELPDEKYCDTGDLLYAWSASFGPRIWEGGKAIYHYHIWKINHDESQVDKAFLFYWFEWDKERIKKEQGAGTTMVHITKTSMEQRSLEVPPIAEQKRIVAILDEAFAGIDAAIANTEKNLANARELFESYLNSVFGKRRDDWRELTLKEVCKDYGRGKSKHRPRNDPELYGGGYPFIQTGDVRRSDHFITGYSKTYNEKGLAQSKLWPRGTICITIAANIAETGVLDFDACFPDSVIGLVVDQTVASNSYVEFLLQSVKSVLKAKGKGSAQDNINLGTFEKERFPFPPLVVQQQIVEDVQELRVLLRNIESIYERKLLVLSELKQSLLQKAFSGELTADLTEKEVDEAVA